MSAMILSEQQIAEIFADPKPLPADARKKLKNPKRSPRRRRLRAVHYVKSVAGKRYQIEATQVIDHPMRFTINVWQRPHRRTRIPLLRLCGHHTPHWNIIERRTKTGIAKIPRNRCHIHRITERYQRVAPEKALHYAEPCTAYHSLATAVEYFAFRYGFYDPAFPYDSDRHPLFPETES